MGTKRKFVTEFETEEKTLTFNIKDFKNTLISKGSAQMFVSLAEIDFEIGQAIDLPTRWKFSMKISNGNLVLFWNLIRYPNDEKEVLASFRCNNDKLLYGGGLTRHFKDYKIHNSDMWCLSESVEDMLNPESKFFMGSNLFMQIIFTLYKEKKMTEKETKRLKLDQFKSDSHTAISEDFQKLLDSGEKADITIQTSEGLTLKAHSAILMIRSPMFYIILRAETTETGVAKIKDLSFETMKIILSFIYTGRMDETWEEHIGEIIFGADKYELKLLKDFCDHSLSLVCKPENAWNFLQVAELHRLEIAQREITDYISKNYQEVMEARKATLNYLSVSN